jgi:glycosyltransferase involved in cell wall biosynthesis
MDNKLTLISICIPTYNQVVYLKKTLDSIFYQKDVNLEIIISDDSTTDDVFHLVNVYVDLYPRVKYIRNKPSLGSPANWNFAISEANGKYIKIMHHDEWFCDDYALFKMVSIARKYPNCFIFAGIKGSYMNQDRTYVNLPPFSILETYRNDPFNLLKGNFIGPPSCILFSKCDIKFDQNLKWLVDIDFYIRLIIEKKINLYYLEEVLFENCMDDHNITNQYVHNLELQLKEYVYLLNKYSSKMSFKLKISYFIFTFQFLKSFKQQNSMVLFLRLLKKRLYVQR